MGDDRVRDALGRTVSRPAAAAGHPLVIAHRGASGYLTEHTLAAKKLAHDQHADFLEQDVVATRDEQLVVCHDLYLERVTNVADVFPRRYRDDGHFYVVDFDWAEICTLARRSVPPSVADADNAALVEEPPYPDGGRLHTLAEELEFIARLNAASSHTAGIYTEIKHPAWYHEHGFDLTRAVVQALESAGFKEPDGSAFIQCFDPNELRRIKETLGCGLPLVQLVGRSVDRQTLMPRGLAGVADYATALAPNFALLLRRDVTDRPVPTAVTQHARDAGLAIHPYTFNYDGLPVYANDLAGFLRTVYALVEPDAVFCDYPDVAVAARGKSP